MFQQTIDFRRDVTNVTFFFYLKASLRVLRTQNEVKYEPYIALFIGTGSSIMMVRLSLWKTLYIYRHPVYRLKVENLVFAS